MRVNKTKPGRATVGRGRHHSRSQSEYLPALFLYPANPSEQSPRSPPRSPFPVNNAQESSHSDSMPGPIVFPQ